MTVVYYHPDFRQQYAADPAASPGRLEPALALLRERHPLETPLPALEEEILLAHTRQHLEAIRKDQTLYHTALLAAGAALSAAQSALRGEIAFALCRPPGHHASPGSCWGFCYFNNTAVAICKLLQEKLIASAMVVDFDLHFGDGTANIFQADARVSYWHGQAGDRLRYIKDLEKDLDKGAPCDLVVVSAGFDRHIRDWGGMLATEDYRAIGRLLGSFARARASGQICAVLEGGYNPLALAESAAAFLEGLEAAQ